MSLLRNGRRALWAVGLALPCFAQVAGNGTILGTVRDASGGAIPQAKVNILRTDTGRNFETNTNNEGYFASPPLPYGNYRLRVEAPGMKAWEQPQLLETGKTVEVQPVLEAGQVTETVNVSGAVPLVTTTDATDASTLDSKRIKELPINGRDLNTLLSQTAPGLEQVYDVNGGVRTGGTMVYSTNYVQDGAPSNNKEFGGSMNLQGLESIGEVRVETSTSSARYNTPASIIVNTKSGTNNFHLSAYETIRNNAFGVARARQDISFNPANPYKTPKLVRNEFGGSVSGPIVIPKLYNGRNRTFFFFSREGAELRQGITKDFAVPTAAMRAGDFSDLIDSTGRKITLYDPLTTRMTTQNGRTVAVRDPFLNNQLPMNRLSPLAKYIFGITPLPTDTTNPFITNNYKAAVPLQNNPDFSDSPTTIRVDHHVSEKDSFYVKANGGRRIAWFQGTGTGTGAPTLGYEANITYLPMQAVSGVVDWTHIFNPTFFVETNVAETWQSTKTTTGPPDQQQNFSQLLGLPNPYGEIGFPNVTGLGNWMTYTEGDNRRGLVSRILSIQQNYSLIRGTHDIQFGWSLLKDRENLLPDQGAISGSASFSSLATALQSPSLGSATQPQAVPQTGYDAANFFLGNAGSYSIGLKRSYLRLHNTTTGMYVQDNYKVSSRLTITPGLRWDINPATTEENDQLNAFDVQSHSIQLPQPLSYYYDRGLTTPQVVNSFQNVGVNFRSADELGRPQNIFPNNYFDFGPRFGVAYRALDGRSAFVIRGGYGLYISAIPMRTLLAQFSGMPPFRATYSYNPNSAATSPDGIQNYLLRTVPTLVAGQNTADVAAVTQPGRGQAVLGVNPNFPNLKVHEWNAMIEKEVGHSMVFRIRYNGKHGVNADQLNDINPQAPDYVWFVTTGQPLPQGAYASVARRPYDQNAYTSVQLLSKTGYINTQLLTFEFQRRFNNGYGFQAFYTLTNALRLGGNAFRDGLGTTPEAFLPGIVPTDPAQLNRYLNYTRDTAVPQHRVRWNFNYDVPVGRNRRFASNVNKVVDSFIGGWKLAGSGTVVSSWWSLPTTNWGATNPLEIYGTSHRILDCRSTSATATNPADERCYEGYLYYNGYISQRQINSHNAAGLRNGVYGLPADYKPFQSPINPWPVGGQPSDPNSNLYDTNNVNIRLNNGTTVQTAYNTGLHPFRNQNFLGPFNWQQDASLQKFFPVTETAYLRLSIDVFNVFNTQGLNVPGSDGVASLQSSYGGFGFRPRQVQIGMRFEW